MIEKSADELDLLREVLASFVVAPEALAVGEDFLMLSSGTFAPGRSTSSAGWDWTSSCRSRRCCPSSGISDGPPR
ncbi:hypothetical protein ACFSSF_09065 [Dietzia aerolata]|uniref:hypothetical protein n=1 Tax=Dietzia aerolata TaxID=595984 RepID=UPI00364543F1